MLIQIMLTFFHGWRRKMAAATLLLACVCFGSWMRSYVKYDVVVLPIGKGEFWLESMWGQLDFGRVTAHRGKRLVASWASTDVSRSNWGYLDKNGNPEAIDFVSEVDVVEWRWAWGGFRFGAGNSPDYRTEDYQFPYWSLEIPLTLLSAYLLLSQPRPKPNQTDDAQNPTKTFPTR